MKKQPKTYLVVAHPETRTMNHITLSSTKVLVLLLTLLAILLVAPSFVSAASNDVVLGPNDTLFTVAGFALKIASGTSTLESITISSNSLTATLQTNSTLTVASIEKRVLQINLGESILTLNLCTATSSLLAFSATSDSQTVIIVPLSSTCSGLATAAAGGGGGSPPPPPPPPPSSGGSGGGGTVATVTTTVTPAAVEETSTEEQPAEEEVAPVTTTAPAATISAVFTNTMGKGLTSPDVKRLQQLLNSDPDTQVAASGVGSLGNETDFYGSLTEKAIQKFQAKYGISDSGDPGYGFVGPLTIARLVLIYQSKVFTTPAVSAPGIPSQVTGVSASFSRTLLRGMSGGDVKRLQQLLNSDPDTQVAASGVGSPGNETDFYGSLTAQAIQKFQAKYGIVSSGSPATTGYGLVGPATRAKLWVVFSGSVISTPATPTPTPTPTPQTSMPSTPSVSPLFLNDLSQGMSHDDVKRLQQLLNSDPDTQVAASGVGSPGSETDFYGSLTAQAVQKFQTKYGVAHPANGSGIVGAVTRAKLLEVFSQ